MTPWVLGTALLVAALLWVERSGDRRLRLVVKTAASLGFVGAALARHPSDPWDHRIVAALLLSAVGDVLLVPDDKRAFLGGMAAFGLAHVAFAAAFLLVPPAATPTAVAGGAMLALAVLVGRALLPRVRGAMRVALPAYLGIIGVMVALGVGAWPAGPRLASVAAVVFALSDLAVARQRFVQPAFVNRAIGLPLYYAAQLAFAATI